MNEKVVMICLEGLGIGGVETVVINQTIAMIKKGIKVVVLANDGIYKQKIIDVGATYINWNFDIKNHVSYENIKKITNIIKDNNITHVIINQFPCINEVVFACLLNNVPYIAYIHSTYKAFENEDVEKNVYEYFKHNYKMFNKYFDMFFKYASQIITITPVSKEYIINKYSINENKVLVIPNSIDIDIFNSVKDIRKMTNFLLISRFSEEKLALIKLALDFFNYIIKKSEDKKYILNIIGDGNKKEEVLSYIKELKLDDRIELLGEVTNVKEFIEECDIVLGIGRCLLEAISMKRLAVICGYDGLKGVVNKDNINVCIDENFSGRLLENVSNEELFEYINNTDIEKINELIEYNYSVCKEKLDINKNIYFLEEKNSDSNIQISLNEVLDILDFATNILDVEKKDIGKLKLKYWELENKHNYIVEDKNNIINEKQQKIEELKLTLNSIYSSRGYKFIQKVKKILGKK